MTLWGRVGVAAGSRAIGRFVRSELRRVGPSEWDSLPSIDLIDEVSAAGVALREDSRHTGRPSLLWADFSRGGK